MNSLRLHHSQLNPETIELCRPIGYTLCNTIKKRLLHEDIDTIMIQSNNPPIVTRLDLATFTRMPRESPSTNKIKFNLPHHRFVSNKHFFLQNNTSTLYVRVVPTDIHLKYSTHLCFGQRKYCQPIERVRECRFDRRK